MNAGELGFSTDTYQLYIGDGAANHEIAKLSVVEAAIFGITPYVIATGEAVTIDADEQLNITEEYIIEGTGSLEVNGDGLLNINDGPNTGVTGSNAPQAHKASHQNGGSDEINVGGSSGLLADDQHVLDSEVAANSAVAANTAKNTYPSADATKVGHISVTQAVNLDTMESNTATNNAKVTNATHTGEVTGSTALTIIDKAVTLAKMNDMATASVLGRSTAGAGVPEVLSKATALSLLNVEDGADITDSTNVNTAGALMESDFNAETFQYATSDDTPQPKTPTQVRDILNIGQTSENLIKNSGFWACSRLSSLVSTGSVLVEDDAANDDTTDWTKSNCTLVFDTDHYVIDPSANYAYIRIAATSKPGHLYKVRFDVKDGTSAGVSITLRVDGCSSETKTTTVAFVSEYFTFHAPLANNLVYLKFGTDPGGNIQIKNFSVYEYNPQFTSTYGSDWHRITSTITAERVCEDYTHCRGFYGMKLTKGVDTAEYYTFSSATPLPPEYAEVIGMTTVFGMYVYSVSAADNVKIQIMDSAGTTESAFIPADTLTWIEISRSVASNITIHDIRVLLDGDTSDISYISFCKYSLGDTIGDGNWSHPKNEIITLELYKDSSFFVANTWNDFAYWQSPQGDSGGAVSAQIEAVLVEMYANDSASAATWAYFVAGPGGNTSWTFVLNLSGLVNDAPGWLVNWIHCHRDGRFYFDIEASGAGTLDIGRFRYKGIMVR